MILHIKKQGFVEKAVKKIKEQGLKVKRYVMGEVKIIDVSSPLPEEDLKLFSVLFSTNSHKDRHDLSAKYRNYYMGNHAILEDADRIEDDRNTLVTNFPKSIIDTANNILISRELTLEGEFETEEEYKNKIDHQANKEICKEAALTGNAWIVVYKDAEQKNKYFVIPDEQVWDIYDMNTGELVKLIRRFYTDDLRNMQQEFIEVYDKDQIRFYRKSVTYNDEFSSETAQNLYAEENGLSLYEINPDKPFINHGFGRIPIVHLTNPKTKPTDLYGTSDLSDVIGLIDSYNENESDESDTLRYHGTPQLVIQGVEGVVQTVTDALSTDGNTSSTATGMSSLTALPRGVKYALLLKDAESKVFYVERNTNTTDFREKREALKVAIFYITCTPLVDTSMQAGDISGVALKMQYRPAEIKADNKGSLYSKKFTELFNLIGVPCTNVRFNLDIPVNETDALARIVTRLENGLWDIEEALHNDPGTSDVQALKQRLLQNQSILTNAYGIDMEEKFNKKESNVKFLLDKKTINSLIALQQQREAVQQQENIMDREKKQTDKEQGFRDGNPKSKGDKHGQS